MHYDIEWSGINVKSTPIVSKPTHSLNIVRLSWLTTISSITEPLVVKLKSSLRKIYGGHHDLVSCYGVFVLTNNYGYVPFIVFTIRSFPHSCLNKSNTTDVPSGPGTTYPSEAPDFIAGFQWSWCCSIFRFLCCVLFVVVCSFGHCVVCSFGHCVVCSFGHCVVCSFGHCIVCPSSIFGFLLPLWYLQLFLT